MTSHLLQTLFIKLKLWFLKKPASGHNYKSQMISSIIFVLLKKIVGDKNELAFHPGPVTPPSDDCYPLMDCCGKSMPPKLNFKLRTYMDVRKF